jgi:parallel beta-helix repeat protein
MFLKRNSVIKFCKGEKSLYTKGLAVGFILLLMGTSVIPITAQDIEKQSLQKSSGNWLYVGGSGSNNYTKIQDAIDNASDGDTVFVFNGTYVGYVIINKSINLIGEDKNTTIINGFFAYTISIISDWVNMSGFTIQNGGRLGEGVRIDSCYNNFVNNIIEIPNDRIRLSGDYNTFSDNTIKDNYIFLSGDSNTISGNTITNDYYGILLIDSRDNIISNNSFFNSGLFISDDTVWNNIVTNNTVNGKPLVYADDESDLVLDIDAGQIILVNCTNITVQNQEIINTTVGIQIWGSTSCIISGNTIAGNHYGLYLYGLNNTINDNTITNNYYGIGLFGNSNTISGNTITNNNDGIYLSYSDHNSIINNTIANNYHSILLDYGSDSNNIITNTITNNYYGLGLSGDSNTISGNTITNNIDEGINLAYSDYNDIINNTITNNNRNGIYIGESDYNNIIGNTITNHTDDGIYLFGDYNTISANTITNNNNGIYVSRHGYNTITSNNIIGNNWSGIYLNCSRNNTISGNSISKNTQGIYFVSSTNNTVLKNNFLRNKRHALFENCTNSWNLNYWGRPRILPKLIFGIRNRQNELPLSSLDIDWHPALKPYHLY